MNFVLDGHTRNGRGKDAFHRVPFITEVWDPVEHVPIELK